MVYKNLYTTPPINASRAEKYLSCIVGDKQKYLSYIVGDKQKYLSCIVGDKQKYLSCIVGDKQKKFLRWDLNPLPQGSPDEGDVFTTPTRGHINLNSNAT